MTADEIERESLSCCVSLMHGLTHLLGPMSNMHPCLNMDEILRILVCELVALEAKATAVWLVCYCKDFEDPGIA